KLNEEATRAEQDKAAAAVKPQTKNFPPGSVLAHGGEPIAEPSLALLTLEHNTLLASRPFSARVAHSLAVLGMYMALYTLCGFYIYYREPRISNELSRLATLLVLVVLTVSLMVIASRDDWRAEVVPLLLFGMTIAIAYGQELALL